MASSTDWWASMGLPWPDLITRGGEPMVRASTLEWTSAARFGDTVTVEAETESVGRTSVVARFVVCVGDRVCCTVRTTYVWVTSEGAAPWPDDVRAALSPT